MAKRLDPAGTQARLVGIEFPGVYVGDERAPGPVDRAKPSAREPVRIETEIAAAADRERIAQSAPNCPWKFPQASRRPGDPVRAARRAGDAIAVVVRRIDTAIDPEAFLGQHVQRP